MTVTSERGPSDAVAPASAGRPVGARLDWRSLERLPSFVGPGASAILLTGICLAVVYLLNGNYYDSIFTLALSYGIVVLGMAVQVGYSHQLAFSQSVFMGFGAYGVAVLNTKEHWALFPASVVVVVVAAFLGLLIGATVTRVPGFALALTTLFLPLIVVSYVQFNQYLGATTGIGGIASLWSGGSFIPTLERSGAIAAIVLGAVYFICARIMKSGIGLELALLGSDERVAASVGVNTPKRKLELFVFGSAVAALGGAVYAGTQNFVATGSFDQTAELTLLVMLFIGGRRSLVGALLGAVGLEYLSGTSNWTASYLLIVEGILFTLILLYAPEGFIDLVRRAAYALQRGGRRVFSRRPPAEETGGAPTVEEGTFGAEASARAAAIGAGFHAMLDPDAIDGAASPAATDPAAPVLEVRGVTKSFGGVRAVDDVSLTIAGKGVHAICGPNGAGKSTLFELVAGGLRADAGEVFIAGRNVTGMPPYRRSQLGMARTLQAVRLMGHRNVRDNVAVAALRSHRTFLLSSVVRSEWKRAQDRAQQALEQLGIAHMAQLRPGALTLEAQRMVELARALVASPRLLLLDEPASGLSVDQRLRLADTLVELGEHMTVVLVEHDLQMVARISREVFVLIDGRLEFHGDGEQFLQSSVVRAQLMGLLAEDELAS